MSPPYEPLVNNYFPAPYSAPHISDTLENGLLPVAMFATLSVVTTALLITFIGFRFMTWRLQFQSYLGYNQYIVLVLNLLLSDLQQSAAFLISWHWYQTRQILAPSPACFAQGWLLNSGDLSSGFFVLAIALHTHRTAAMNRRVGNKLFAAFVAGIWVLAYFLTFIGVGVHGKQYFVRAGAWCWVSAAYERERLFCHYFWVFGIGISTIILYMMTFCALRKKTKLLMVNGRIPANSPSLATVKSVNRITKIMMLYPCFYLILTMPLAVGRMWSMSHGGEPSSDTFSCIAGSFLTSCGWVDSLLYTLTREKLLQDTMPRFTARGTPVGDCARELGHEMATLARNTQAFFTPKKNTDRGRLEFPSPAYKTPPSISGSAEPFLGLLAGGTERQSMVASSIGSDEWQRSDGWSPRSDSLPKWSARIDSLPRIYQSPGRSKQLIVENENDEEVVEINGKGHEDAINGC